MRKNTTLIILFFGFLGFVNAQNTHELSLQQAIELALQNAEDLKNLRLDEQIQQHVNDESTGLLYPQISASGQGTYYTSRPQIQFPSSNYPIYQVLQDEGVKDGSGNPISTSQSTTTSQPISFVAPLNFQFGISINQILFQPDVFIALQARETVLQYTRDNLKVSENNIKESVKKAYYAVLIAEEQKRITEATSERLDQLSAEMTRMFQSGFTEQLDIDKIEVTKNNTQAAINQLNNAINISKSLLKNTLGLPIGDEVSLTEKLEPLDLEVLLMTAPKDFDYDIRDEITLLKTAKRLQELDLKRQESAILPTVGAFYSFDRAGQRNPDFAAPGESPWFWYNTGLLGISVKQPIFSGFQFKHRVSQAQLKLEKVDNNLNQVKRLID
ncbi:MAG: TolC family protein, partial [Saprospiraceae bacterium]|nr:TolC family protein [Saprospiraceae bacterium]